MALASSNESGSEEELAHNFPPFFKVHTDGKIERYMTFERSSPGSDPSTGVESKDIMVSSETGVNARLFLPETVDKKLPLLVHYHGGGFCLGSAMDLAFKVFLSKIVAEANVIAISIDYRLAPENPIPTCHNDAWAAFQWIGSHANGLGPEPWLNNHADFGRVYLIGESAGANIAHYVAVTAGANGLDGVNVIGSMMVHPYFGAAEPDAVYQYMCPTSGGFDSDPILNPAVDPNLVKMKSEKILVLVAENDKLKSRGVYYYEVLGKREWNGKIEFYETLGEDHCFHMFNTKSENVEPLMKKLIDFILN